MNYYCMADVHGFYDEMLVALKQSGYYKDENPKKIVLLGDLFDRGKQTLELQSFAENLVQTGEGILIRGNHEDLMEELVENLDTWSRTLLVNTHHFRNGTFQTLSDLTDIELPDIPANVERVKERYYQTPFFQRILPAMKDYYETKSYIFVHGWIPCDTLGGEKRPTNYFYRKDWRTSTAAAWSNARWYNGMEAAFSGAIEEGKTIVCGHWHASYGHARKEGKSEFDSDADFSPFFEKGILALDACTSFSGKVNCVKLTDEELD